VKPRGRGRATSSGQSARGLSQQPRQRNRSQSNAQEASKTTKTNHDG
jgi:hypothetical protein